MTNNEQTAAGVS